MFRFFAIAAALAAFVLAVLGSWVRINGAGMTCPDWPLCNGALIPSLQGGVILEWGHRFVALLLGIPVAGALWMAWRERERIAFVRQAVGFVGGVFVLQVALGAATVRLANNPPSVVLHWGTGMAFLAGLTALAVLAVVRPRPLPPRPLGAFAVTLGCTAFAAFVAMCAGAYVSSSGAGLACATLPDCDGSLFGSTQLQNGQMIHRIAAGALFLCAAVVTYWSIVAASPRVRATVLAGFALLVVQIMLGLANVAWHLPTILREAHAANAAAVFIAFSIALVLAVLDSARGGATAETHQPLFEPSAVRTR